MTVGHRFICRCPVDCDSELRVTTVVLQKATSSVAQVVANL